MSRSLALAGAGSRRGRAARAIISGFAATGAMTLTLLMAYTLMANLAMVLPNTMLGAWFAALTHNTVVDLTTGSLALAIGLHFVIGITLGLLYASLAEPRLPGADWQRGLMFALIPYLVSVAVVLPALGGGPFGLSLGAGPLPVLGNLVLHLIYGVTLGTVYGRLGSTEDWLVRDGGVSMTQRRTEARYEVGSAVGLVLGATIGGGLGAAFGSGLDTMTPSFPDLDPWTYALAGALLGAAAGLLAGSLAGLTPTEEITRSVITERRLHIMHMHGRGSAARLRVRRQRAAQARSAPRAA